MNKVQPGADFSIREGEFRLHTRGLTRTIRALEEAGADTADMRELMHRLGMIVVRDAQRRSPRGATSKLVNSLRAGRGKTKAVVRAGGKKVPYAGVIHYGTPKGFKTADGHGLRINENPYLVKSLTATKSAVYTELVEGLNEILKKNNLI